MEIGTFVIRKSDKRDDPHMGFIFEIDGDHVWVRWMDWKGKHRFTRVNPKRLQVVGTGIQ